MAAITGFSQRTIHEGIGDSLLTPARCTSLERLLHILAGAEGAAGAGEDRHLKLIAVPKLAPRLGQQISQLLAKGVETLRPVHTDHHHLVLALGFHDCHLLSPLSGKMIFARAPRS